MAPAERGLDFDDAKRGDAPIRNGRCYQLPQLIPERIPASVEVKEE